MSPKLLFLSLQIFLIKNALSQCFGSNPAAIAESLGLIGAASAGPAGGPFLLQNFPMPTPGLSIVADELVIEGLVSVSGRLPFVGTVAVEGVLPTEGHGTVVYGCGNGEIGIVGEGPGPIGSNIAPGPAFPSPASLASSTFPGPLSLQGAIGPTIAPFTSPCSSLVPQIDPGMAAVANTAAMAAAATASGQAAVTTSLGIGAAANAVGLNAMTGL